MAEHDTQRAAEVTEKAEGIPDDLNLINAGYVADLYELYRADPDSSDPEWRARFDAGFAGLDPVQVAPPATNCESPPAAPGTRRLPECPGS